MKRLSSRRREAGRPRARPTVSACRSSRLAEGAARGTVEHRPPAPNPGVGEPLPCFEALVASLLSRRVQKTTPSTPAPIINASPTGMIAGCRR